VYGETKERELVELSLCLVKHHGMMTKGTTFRLQVLDRNGPQHPLEGPQKRYMYSADSLPHSWGRPATSLATTLTELSQLLRRILAKPLRIVPPLGSVSAITCQ
jgi:hypothetical protein